MVNKIIFEVILFAGSSFFMVVISVVAYGIAIASLYFLDMFSSKIIPAALFLSVFSLTGLLYFVFFKAAAWFYLGWGEIVEQARRWLADRLIEKIKVFGLF